MNKTVVGIVIALLAVGAIAGAVVMNKPKTTSTTSTDTTSTRQTTDTPNPDIDPDPNSSPSQIPSRNSVDIVYVNGSFAFAPVKTMVKKGATVTWTNQSDIRHDVTPDQGTADFKPSTLLKKGETYQITFNNVGTFTYHCSPHPSMKGIIQVVE